MNSGVVRGTVVFIGAVVCILVADLIVLGLVIVVDCVLHEHFHVVCVVVGGVCVEI